MKIRIKGETNLTLLLPTRLLFSKRVVHLISRVAGKWVPDVVDKIPMELLEAALDELVRTKKRYGSWELLEIQSAEGEYIKITL